VTTGNITTEFEISLLKLKLSEAEMASAALRHASKSRSVFVVARHDKLDSLLAEIQALVSKQKSGDV
jgi:hypothetical protein